MNKKIVISVIIIVIIISIIIWIGVEQYKENNIGSTDVINISENNNTSEQQVKQYPKEKIIETYKGYDVCAKLEIPKISLETYVLKNYSTYVLNVSVTKFWGADPNEVGNFCIAGHNFQNKNMFRNLKNLEIGDKLFVTDNNIGKVEYEIYNMNTVLPNNVDCLSQETNYKEVTLITCTNDSKKRIIVKAKEIQ